MRAVLTIVSILAILLGGWWVAQGTGLAPYGFMANNIVWAYRGAGLAAVGLLILVLVQRR